MGLDVGVVTIEYMRTPTQIVQDFLFDLLLDPYAGVDDGGNSLDEEWSGHWENNALCEFWRDSLMTRAGNWANEKAIGVSERTVLMNWVVALPWPEDGRIMLHLGS